MSHLKLNLIAVILITCQGLFAQGNIDHQYFVYTSNANDNDAVINAADALSSSVVEFAESGQHIALLEWDGNPFNYNGYPVNTMVDIMSVIKGKTTTPPPVDIDGGTANRIYNPNKGIGDGGTNKFCYPHYSGSDFIPGTVTTVGIFDTGLNYENAQNAGYTFNTVIPVSDNINDLNGHGTHVATIIDGIYHQYVEQSPLQYVIGSSFNQNGQSTLYNLVECIEDALHLHIVDIMNFSFSYTSTDETTDAFYLLLASPVASDVLFVCSAGNSGHNIDGPTQSGIDDPEMVFPAAFTLSSILSVGSYGCASKSYKVKSSFSNYGTTSVDFAAPGEEIEGLDQKGELIKLSGTSQSAAKVTAAAAVLKSKNNQKTVEDLKCLLIQFSENTANFAGKFKYPRTLDLDNVLANSDVECLFSSGFQANSLNQAIQSEERVKLSPVPFADELNIQYESETNSTVSIQIYTISGALVNTTNSDVSAGKNNISLNFSSILYSNHYILRIISNDGIETRKISRF